MTMLWGESHMKIDRPPERPLCIVTDRTLTTPGAGMLGRHSRRVRMLVVLGLAAGAAVVPVATAAGGSSPGAAFTTPTAPISPPTDAKSGANASISALSCPSAGNCVAVGTYTDSTNTNQMMYAVESNGSWAQGVKLSPPSNVASPNFIPTLTGISCTGVGYCVAVGGYKSNETTALRRGVIFTETAGVWSEQQAPTDPLESPTSGGDALGSVSCTSAGNCLAGGFYVDAISYGRPMVDQETDGHWATPIELPQPSDSQGLPAAAVKVTCTSQANCVAATQYLTSTGPVDYRGMAAVETAGTWGPAVQLPLPANANSTTGTQDVRVNSVECASVGNCVVVGDYQTAAETHPFTATETGSAWQPAVEVTLPSDAAPSAPSMAEVDTLTSVSCPTASSCVATGWYTYTDPTCANCVKPIAVDDAGGSWGDPQVLSVPEDSISPPSAGLAAVACTAVFTCTVVGSYRNSSGAPPMVATSVPALAITTTTLPAATVGTAYRAQLSASGGVGSADTWSLSSGALPVGLSLDPATGLITGTPTAAGTTTFTVQATDPGPPSQHGTAPLSITVSAVPTQPVPTQPVPTQSVTARSGNQRIALTGPAMSPCVASTGSLTITLTSTKINGAPRLSFVAARVYIDKGLRRTIRRTVHGKPGKRRVVYKPNATVTQLPANLRLSLAGVRAGSHTVSATLRYTGSVVKHGHRLRVHQTRTLRLKISVC